MGNNLSCGQFSCPAIVHADDTAHAGWRNLGPYVSGNPWRCSAHLPPEYTVGATTANIDEVNRIATLLINAWERVDDKVNVSRTANFVDMARAVIGDRIDPVVHIEHGGSTVVLFPGQSTHDRAPWLGNIVIQRDVDRGGIVVLVVRPRQDATMADPTRCCLNCDVITPVATAIQLGWQIIGDHWHCPNCAAHARAASERVTSTKDPINPSHYKGDLVMRIIELFKLDFPLGNTIKYILRHGEKAGLEDLKKSRWYLDRKIAELEGRLTEGALK